MARIPRVPEAIPNILTVAVEDWFHVLEGEGAPGREDWPQLDSEPRKRILDLRNLATASPGSSG